MALHRVSVPPSFCSQRPVGTAGEGAGETGPVCLAEDTGDQSIPRGLHCVRPRGRAGAPLASMEGLELLSCVCRCLLVVVVSHDACAVVFRSSFSCRWSRRFGAHRETASRPAVCHGERCSAILRTPSIVGILSQPGRGEAAPFSFFAPPLTVHEEQEHQPRGRQRRKKKRSPKPTSLEFGQDQGNLQRMDPTGTK